MDDLERCLSSVDGSASADVLAQARTAAAAVRHELEMHKQASAARQKSGQDWQTIASERETEVVRLRAEINRMRQALSSSTQAHGSQAEELAALQAQLQEALALNKAQQRQALVTTSAVDGPNAELHRLRAELEGRTEQLRRAEADLDAHKVAAATRLNEVQETFSSKIADIRRNHQLQLEQALAAARSAAAAEAQAQARTGPRAGAAALEQANAQRLQRAEAEAASLRQQVEAAQATTTELQGKLKQAQSDAESCRAQLTSSQFSEKALKARVKDLEAQLAKAQQQHQEQMKETQLSPPAPAAAAAPSPPPKNAPPAVDMGMLSMMEGQLGRLSEIIRSREAEMAQMRAALQNGLDERRDLLRQVEALQTALLQAQQQLQLQQHHQQQQYGSAPGSTNGSVNGGGGGGGGGSSNGLGSPKSGSGAVPARGGLPQVGPNRPYRTGLQSKPRFFK